MALKATVAKTFDFPASHQVTSHPGHCARVHGHTWELTIFVRGTVNEDFEKPGYGMVIDFYDLKEIYKEAIEPLVEHQHLNDTLKGQVMEFTTEVIAGYILQRLHEREKRIFKVRLCEGKTSYVEVCLRDLGIPTPIEVGHLS